jgi:hypothetical protein
MDQQQTSMNGGFPPASGKESHIGPLIGGVIVALALLSAMYIWMSGIPEEASPAPETNATAPVNTSMPAEQDAATAALSQQATSDEIPAIDQDLKNTDLNSLGTYLEEI